MNATIVGRVFEGMSAPEVPAVSPGRARYALGVLFTINLFNYIDRQVISGVLPLVQQDLRLSDTALGWLASAFMILYLTGSIPLGVLGDRIARNRLIAVGVGMWGAATFLWGLFVQYLSREDDSVNDRIEAFARLIGGALSIP